ncbi:ubiquitin-associated domain-containing protein 2-like [Macrobrachium rosenbergii]|uniref:ubiquitin-associated domain-containing protein 2-like n=1 Tax=Macrobrachium rosenbergii TaxID=79674 RepID=UPI0034D3E31B
MATILSQYSTTGFYNAPVSKGLMGCMFMTCTALNVPLFAHLRKYLICKLPDVFLKGEIWRIASAKISFVDTKDLVCGSLLIYYFRVFERRYGSRKFASCLVASQVLTTVLEVLTILTLQWLAIDLHSGGFLPPGPYGVIFPLFVNYLFDIPRVAQTSVLGIPITGKTLTYLLGLQVCSTSPATAISAFCGIVAGFFYRYNVLWVQQVPWVPGWLARGAKATLARLLASPPPPEGPAGATLELQRQEQIEVWEQQIMINRAREMRNRPGANGAVPHFIPDIMGRRQNNPGHPPPPPTEEQVQTLVEMGFDRQRVINALQTCNNDVNTATHLLLQES